MSGKTAAIIGATGMTGTSLVELLLEDDYFSTVRIIVRRPQPRTSPKMEVKLVDFNDAESVKLALEDCHAVFCCIGTTQKKVKGDKALYRKVDFDIPVKTARFCKEAGCEKFIIITAAGADSQSGNFYLQLKGEVEEALSGTGIRSIHIMQPGLLLGKRNENRPVERISQAVMARIPGLLFGPFKKYRPISAKMVAAAMLAVAKKEEAGLFRYNNEQIVKAVVL